MSEDISTRMGDGQRITMSVAQVKEDLVAGTKDAAERGEIPELRGAELDHLFEIIADRNRIVGVEPGEEVVLTDDLSVIRAREDEGAGGAVGMPISRLLADLVHERALAQDSAVFEATAAPNIMEIKSEIDVETQAYETASLLMTIPLLYLIAPALLWYYQPSGPYENPSDIMPQGKIKEAREASE
ncbi:MAG: [dimethylamine--corrinoid protein] Co-methyltransferase, partial [Dehalococcoidia bacterium]